MVASYTAYLRFVELPSRLIDRAVDQIAGFPVWGAGRRSPRAAHAGAKRGGCPALHRCHRGDEGGRQGLSGLRQPRGRGALQHLPRRTQRQTVGLRWWKIYGTCSAIEATGHFRGRYHVLGGVISPMDGVGPADLRVESLMSPGPPKEAARRSFSPCPPRWKGTPRRSTSDKRLRECGGGDHDPGPRCGRGR